MTGLRGKPIRREVEIRYRGYPAAEVVIVMDETGVSFRVKRRRFTTPTVAWGWIYDKAAKLAADDRMKATAAKKKARKGK